MAFLQLALQLAVLVSKVARFDCPTEWPELVPTLLQVVRNPDDLPQQRSLLVLHHVTKSLASKRLAGDRRVFQEVSSKLCHLVIVSTIAGSRHAHLCHSPLFPQIVIISRSSEFFSHFYGFKDKYSESTDFW